MFYSISSRFALSHLAVRRFQIFDVRREGPLLQLLLTAAATAHTLCPKTLLLALGCRFVPRLCLLLPLLLLLLHRDRRV